MTLQRVISFGHIKDNFRGAQTTMHLSAKNRLSHLEDLRREAARIFHYEYPRRIRRILEVVERG